MLSLESLSSFGFEERNLGCPRNFAGLSRTPGGVQKVCVKKVRAHFSFPKSGSTVKERTASGTMQKIGMVQRASVLLKGLPSDKRRKMQSLLRILRSACLQNEIAPEKCLNRYEKWFEKKRSEK